MNEAVSGLSIAVLNWGASAFDTSWRVGQVGVEARMAADAAGEEVAIAHQLVPDNGRFFMTPPLHLRAVRVREYLTTLMGLGQRAGDLPSSAIPVSTKSA